MLYYYIAWLGFFTLLLPFSGLNAVLDGRVTPIYLESRYTFTNFEWTRGRVYFKQGFDLPVGGTIFYGSSDLVNADINLNHGTIVFQNSLMLSSKATLQGTGFLDFQGYALRLQNDLTLSGTDSLYIVSSGSIIGEADTIISPSTGALVCMSTASFLELSNLSLYNPTSRNFVTQEMLPESLLLNKVDIILSHQKTFTLFSRYVQLKNQVTLKGSTQSPWQIVNQCKIVGSAQLNLFSGSFVIVKALTGDDATSSIILDSSSLQYTTTEPNFYIFSSLHETASSDLTMVLKGKNRLVYPVGSAARLSHDAIVLFNPGARLIIPENSYLVMD